MFGKLCTDLANYILHGKELDPAVLFSPHQYKLPPPIYLDDSIPFLPTVNLDIEIPADDIESI
jgi:hypothetical protein